MSLLVCHQVLSSGANWRYRHQPSRDQTRHQGRQHNQTTSSRHDTRHPSQSSYDTRRPSQSSSSYLIPCTNQTPPTKREQTRAQTSVASSSSQTIQRGRSPVRRKKRGISLHDDDINSERRPSDHVSEPDSNNSMWKQQLLSYSPAVKLRQEKCRATRQLSASLDDITLEDKESVDNLESSLSLPNISQPSFISLIRDKITRIGREIGLVSEPRKSWERAVPKIYVSHAVSD